jgi:hypothetical protein
LLFQTIEHFAEAAWCLEMPDLDSSSPAGLVTEQQLDPAKHDFFLVRVPAHLPASVLQDAVIDLRGATGALHHEGRDYEPVVERAASTRTLVLPGGGKGDKVGRTGRFRYLVQW